MMDNTAIQIDAVTKRFPGSRHAAIDTLTAALHAGHVTGLVGPDGAGKTTLLRLIAGLLKPATGHITVCGLDTMKEAEQIHRLAGYMPQKFGLYEDLSVMENLRLYADLRGVTGDARKERFATLLRFTGLTEFTGRMAGALSGGMKQKLGLACALIRKPRVLLLDEPSVGVDPISRRELWRMVQELVDDEMAAVWSTAYLDEAEKCAQVLLLSEGKLIFAGRPQDLTAELHDRTWLVQGAHTSRRQVLTRALEQEDVIDGIIQGSSVRIVMAESAAAPLPHALAAGEPVEVVPARPRFEDAFVARLGGGPGGHSALAATMHSIPDDGRAVVEARNLTKRFGAFTAADAVTFTIPRGEVFGLLGPNGAGKSTTFKMLCGLLQPSAGEALVTGLDLKKAPGKARARIGYMAQKFSLYGDLTVRQNLGFFSGAYGLAGRKRRETVAEMIEVFALEPYLGVPARELPLGFKQRLALACSVMHEPDVLFLDEPTSGVDPLTRREFWTHINGMVEKGVTIVVTTHFLDEAEYCDRIGLIYRGRIIAIDGPDALKAAAATNALPEPTLEDAFIGLIERTDRELAEAAA
ncbi:MAG: ABC transporter ATP-binding protein [Candidatus Hydrogenedentes bacterium]|nr:ABC transporter ATP-binding protein [Candidatus Hydrogenedentota bacterium]